MTRDDFDTWRKEPATQFIFAQCRKAAEREKAEWIRQTWDSGHIGQLNPIVLAELRARAAAFEDLIDNTYETWMEWSEDE